MRVVALRLREGQDLKGSVEDVVREQQLPSATVISAVGSLSKAKLRMAGAEPDKQDVREYNEPLEIVSLIGNLGQGRVHLHMSVSDKDGTVYGGHLKEGSIVHTTVELMLAVDDSLEFSEKGDPVTGFGELKIAKAKV